MKTFGRTASLVMALVMLITALPSCAFIPSEKASSFAFYVKDDQLLMMDIHTETVYPLTQHLNTERDSRMAGMVRLNEAQSRLFYLDRDSNEDGAAESIYMRDLTNRKAEAVRIDHTVGIFDISKDGNTLAYLKKLEDGRYALCQYDENGISLVTEGLTGFGFTEQNDCLYFTLGDEKMNYLTGEKGKKSYHLSSDPSTAMTFEEFEAKTGGTRKQAYAFEGLAIDTYYVIDNDKAVDEWDYEKGVEGKIWTMHGCETYFGDRLLYFTYTQESETANIKQYVRGEKPQVIDQIPTTLLPSVAYTSDGLPLYLQDYDEESKQGQMMLYQNGKCRVLEEGINRLVDLNYVLGWTYSLQKHMNWT